MSFLREEFLEGTAKETEVVALMLEAVERAAALPKGTGRNAFTSKSSPNLFRFLFEIIGNHLKSLEIS